MKKLLLSVSLLVSIIANAQLPVETFSGTTFPPTGWTTANTNAARPWGFTTAIFNATGQATYNINGTAAAINWIASANDAHLTTPSFSLEGYSSANLLFSAKVGWSYMIDIDAGDFLVSVSTDGGTNWDGTLWSESEGGWLDDGDGDENTDLYDTRDIVIDMSAYLGQSNLKVRFQYVGADADAISLDDVRVLGTLSNSEFASSKFSTYPNPANEVINIINATNVGVESISISDINGRTVKTVDVVGSQINVSDLNSGIYFLNINSAAGKAVEKFVKN